MEHVQTKIAKLEEKIHALSSKHTENVTDQRSLGTRRALLIGINYFGSEYELQGCLNDVDRTSDLLQKQFGFKPENIVVMKDDKKDPEHKSLLAPTKKNIINHIKQLIYATKPGDYAYFHYSGHGSHTRDINGDENDLEDEMICTVDSDEVLDDDLHVLFVENLAKGAKLRCVFDCCHSGTILDLKYRLRYDHRSYNENINERCAVAGCYDKDVVMISGCMDSQTSADAHIGSKFAGALTWGLCESIEELLKRGNGKIPSSITWEDLVSNIRFKLAGSRYEQIPQLTYTENQYKLKVDL